MTPAVRVERRRVYVTYRKLFSGRNALVRAKKTILKILHTSPTFRPSAGQHLESKTISILKSLLSDRIFELEEAAKKEFPELWSKTSPDSKAPTKYGPTHCKPTKLEETEGTNVPQVSLHAFTVTDETKSILFSPNITLPQVSYNNQHQVLATVQQILEASCFKFTQEWLPSVLLESAWSCAAAVELTKWLQVMEKHVDTLPEACIDDAGCAMFKEIRPRLAHLRHSAVHRLRLGLDEVLEKVHAALKLTRLLRDDSSASKLQAAYTRLKANIDKTKHDSESTRREVNHAILELQRQREALCRKEHQLRAFVMQKLSSISEAADQSLVDCTDGLLDIERAKSGSEQSTQHKKHTGISNCSVYVNDDDIESDEDQLRADLG